MVETAPRQDSHATAGDDTPPTARDVAYLPTLDGWRALAVLMVMASHSLPTLREAYGKKAIAPLAAFFWYGREGVYIFFGISGFLICSRLLHEYRVGGRVHLRRFYIRRAHRILPPLLVFLTITGILGVTGVLTLRSRDWLAALCFGANYVIGLGFYFAHFWTLAMEEHFYIVFPPILAWLGSRRTLRTTIAIALMVAVWRTIDLRFHVTYGLLPDAWERTDSGCDGLLWGCVLALFCDDVGWQERLRRWMNPKTFLLLAAALIVVIVKFASGSFVVVTICGFARVLLIPLLLVTTVEHPRSVVSRVLEWRLLKWIGRMSYSLYLWQQVFLVFADPRAPLMGPMQRWPLNIVVACLCAVASYYLIEKPMIREGYRVTAKMKPATGAIAPAA